MSINYSYKQANCYANMDVPHQESFDRLVNAYGEKLNKGCPIGNVLFTAHDFNKHCNNIFNIIDEIILKNHTEFTCREYYILCLSVLFHDISMSVNINWNRKRHSIQSAEYLREQSENTSSAIAKEITETLLTRNDIKTIGLIISAHSDVKDGSLTLEENGINNPKLQTNMTGGVNGKLLAAILRLADELDITSDRIGTQEFSDQLDENDEVQFESKKHWENLHYFSEIKIDLNNTSVLQLCCDDDYISTRLDDIRNVYDQITAIQNKIQNELDSLNKEVFRKSENGRVNFHIERIEIMTDLQELKNVLENKESFDIPQVSPENMVERKKEISCQNDCIALDSNMPKVLNAEAYKSLNEFIIQNELFKGGHYLFTEEYCAMDWIDTAEIIETSKICEACIDEFAENILDNKYKNNILILGLDFLGSIIASQLALYLHMPFQCVIPAKSEYEHAIEDISDKFPDEKNIIIVADVISTYNTILSVINSYGLEDRIKGIYTILYRDPNAFDEDKGNKYKEITYCISDAFPMNIKEKETCKYFIAGECIAENKKYDIK